MTPPFSAWWLLHPLVFFALLGLWVYCIQDALRHHRPWGWVAVVVFLPVVSAPFYLVNFHVLGRGGRGFVDAKLVDAKQLEALQDEANERGDVGRVHRDMAEVLYRQRDYQGALKSLTRALDLDAEDLRSQYLASLCLVELGHHERALAHLEYLLGSDPRYAIGAARLAYANALANLGRNDEAFAQYSRVVRDHLVPEASVRLSRALVLRGDPEGARRELRDMLNRVADLNSEDLASSRPWIKQAAEELRNIK